MTTNRLLLKIAIIIICISSISLAEIGNSKTKTYPASFFKGDHIQGLSTVKVLSIDKVVAVKFTSPYNGSQEYVYAGTFNGDANGTGVKLYCIDILHELAFYSDSQPHTYTDSGNTTSKITYILNKYYPFKAFPYAGSLSAEEREAAAVQFAIWHNSDGVDVSTLLDNPDILARANQIIADADLNAGNVVPVETLIITPVAQTLQTGTTETFYITALDHNNNPLPNVQVTLTSTSGTLSTFTSVTGNDGKTPVISLVPGSQSTATISAVANVTIPQGTRYVHSLQPDNFQKLVLATPVTSLKQATASINWMNLLQASIGDFVWNDANHNGIQDAGEAGIANITVQLYNCSSNSLVATTTTNASGSYLFNYLAAGSYYVQFVVPAGYTVSPASQGIDLSLDSNPDATGKTACIALATNVNNLTIDAGMYISAPILGSIGDFVWNDANHNGIQDAGEAGIANVAVQLYKCSDNSLVTSTTTNASGAYLFSSVAAGDYYVKFVVPSGYTVSSANQGVNPAMDSNPDATGKTACITLAAGENNLTIDAGMYVPGSTSVTLTKDDGRVFMADSGSTDTYTIHFANTGNTALHSVTITDTLPAGLTYVSCTGANSCGETGNQIIVFQVGNLNPSDAGSVTLTAMVSKNKSNYLNVAYLNGTDSYGIPYTTTASDLDIHDTTSGGNTSGAESNGNMSELLLKRLLKIESGQTTRILTNSKYGDITTGLSLKNFVPQTGPFSSSAVETTPFDILGISNAVSSYAADYMVQTGNGSKRIGGVFSTITPAPYIYDHTKAVCDRLAGADVSSLDLVTIDGKDFYAAKLVKPGTTDYAVSFTLFETPTGFSVQNKWTYEEYIAPNNTSAVYNFQVWSSALQSTVSIVETILHNASNQKPLTFLNNSQANPTIYIKDAAYSHDGKINLTLVNKGESSQVSFNTTYRPSQSGDQLETTQNFTVSAGESSVSLNSGIVADAQVHLNTPQGFKDEVYTSGGAYTYMNGASSSVSSFNTASYPQENTSQFPAGSLVLSGGVNLSCYLNDWISVVRSLNASASVYDLTNYYGLTFKASGLSTVQIFIDMDGVQNYNYFVKTINLTSSEKTFTLKFSDFNQRFGNQISFDPSKIKYIGFILDRNMNPDVPVANFEVKDIAFLNSLTGVHNNSTSPVNYNLSQNYPNPFNPSTTIKYALPNASNVVLRIYDIMGREIRTLVNEEKNAGTYSALWDGRNNNGTTVSSGIYLYKINAGSYVETKKMILVK